jgi:stage II sporulation protein D
MKKYVMGFLIYCAVVLLFVPVGMVKIFGSDITETGAVIRVNDTQVPQNNGEQNIPATENKDVTEDKDDTVVQVDDELENYIIGVVAAEMPALFDDEALKAQAVAARTYATNQMQKSGITIDKMIENGGQAYLTQEEMKTKWNTGFDKYYKKIKAAVLSTKGEIMVYNNEPILAVFHAISCGKTEVAENVWNDSLPYLKSVDSSMDKQSSEYTFETTMSAETVVSLLQKANADLKLYDGGLKEQMQIIERTDAGYIKTMQIGNKVFTGKQVREILGLRSSDFTVKQDGDNMIFTTYGYGHGAGMSQYGAECMAKDGKSYKDILSYYYTGIEFEKTN